MFWLGRVQQVFLGGGGLVCIEVAYLGGRKGRSLTAYVSAAGMTISFFKFTMTLLVRIIMTVI